MQRIIIAREFAFRLYINGHSVGALLPLVKVTWNPLICRYLHADTYTGKRTQLPKYAHVSTRDPVRRPFGSLVVHKVVAANNQEYLVLSFYWPSPMADNKSFSSKWIIRGANDRKVSASRYYGRHRRKRARHELAASNGGTTAARRRDARTESSLEQQVSPGIRCSPCSPCSPRRA